MKLSDCPMLHDTILIGDDAYLLAKMSSILGRKDCYLPIIDGPRLQRPDADAEVVRRNNAVARSASAKIFFVGMDDSVCDRFKPYFPSKLCHRISKAEELRQESHNQRIRPSKKLHWGKEKIGIGLLKALRTNCEIEFDKTESPEEIASTGRKHLIVCEEGNEMSQVIAANYAYSLDADLCLIPFVSDEDAEQIWETLYCLYDDRRNSLTSILENIRLKLKQHASLDQKKGYRLITFISKAVPWGLAFPEVPTCHLFIYPDLGISIINAITSEQAKNAGLKTAVVVDPDTVGSTEVEVIAECLAKRSVLVRGFRGHNATVSEVSRTLELFPYDLLLIATHCGDANGWRETFEFTDSEDIKRKLVIDLAISLSQIPGNEKIKVNQFERFVSLDGVDWNDRKAKEDLYVGKAINDFYKQKSHLKPIHREEIERVHWSAALKMYDHNLIALPVALASNSCPIILNNACASWRRLAENFIFGNARAYIGTLYSVTNVESQEIALNLLDKQFGKPVAEALWNAQNEVYKDSSRRPYLIVGPHFQKLRASNSDGLKYLLSQLSIAQRQLTKLLKGTENSKQQQYKENIEYLNAELSGLLQTRR